MEAKTRAKLSIAARSVGLAMPTLMAGHALATVNGPYGVDGNTVVLYHFDEPAGSSFSVNQQPFPGQNNAIGFVQTAAATAGTVDTTILGKTGASGFGFGNFGNAAATTGNQVLGYDGNGNSTFEPDLSTNTTNTNTSADAVTSGLFTDPSTGAFSLDAMVNIPTAYANGTNHEIVSWDSSNGTAAQRGFQFRFSVSATGVVSLQYDNISDGIAAVTVPVPTQGSDAFTLNKWFHVAMTYDGSQGPASVKLYWTAVDDANTKAHLIGSGGQNDLTGSANPNVLTFGNENRNTAGEALGGSLDELRISNNARAATDFLFGGASPINAWNVSTGGDWDQSGAWTISTPNSAGAVADFGDGNNSPTADSVITITGSKTVGELDFNSVAFKYTLTPISVGGGTLVLNNNGGVTTVNNLGGNHTIALPVTLGGAGNNFTVTVGTLTVASPMSNPGGGAGAVTKLGPGVMVVTGTNTYTGATSVGQGVLRAPDGNGLPTTSNLVLNGGVYQTGVNFARAGGTGGNQMQISGGASGFGAFGADIQVTYGTIASPAALTWGSSTFNPSTFVLNDPTATNNISFLNAINLNGAARTIEVDTNNATLNGALTTSTGTASLIKVGNGLLVLTGTNTYNGTTTITTGTLRADSGVGLSPNTNLSVAGGIYESAANLTRALGTGAGQLQIPGPNPGQFNANNASITLALTNGGSPITWGSAAFAPSTIIFNTGTTGNITFTPDLDLAGGGRTVQVSNNVAAFSGNLSDSLLTGTLTKTGAGVLALTGTNTYTTPTLVTGGSLRVAGGGLPDSNITLNGGYFQPVGSASVSIGTGPGQIQFTTGLGGFSATNSDGTVTVDNGATLTLGTAPYNPGTLGFLSSNAAITLTNPIDLGTAARTINVNGGTAILTGGITGGAGGSLQLSGSGLLVLTSASNYSGTTALNFTNVQGAAGNISVRAAASNSLGTGTVSIGSVGNSALNRLELANNATLPNYIQLWARSVGNTAQEIESISGSNTLSGQVTMGVGGAVYIIQSDAGTLTLSAANNTVNPGVAILGGAADVGSPSGNRIITLQGAGNGVVSGAIVNGTATLSLNKAGPGSWLLTGSNTYNGISTVRNGTLELGVNAQSPVLTATPGGADIQGGKLVLDYAPGNSPATTINGLLATSFNSTGGFTNTANRLISTTATGTLGLGMSDDGVSAVTVGYTVFGDANVDGKVNALDFNAVATNFGTTSGALWYRGDFNYDGQVNTLDFTTLAQNFGQVAPTPTAAPDLQAPALGSLVPEPTSMGVIGSAIGWMLSRRRRRAI